MAVRLSVASGVVYVILAGGAVSFLLVASRDRNEQQKGLQPYVVRGGARDVGHRRR